MKKILQEGLDLAQQIAALPFKAVRQALQEHPLEHRSLGEVVQDSLTLGEGLARLPFKAVAALMSDMAQKPVIEPRADEVEGRQEDQPPT